MTNSFANLASKILDDYKKYREMKNFPKKLRKRKKEIREKIGQSNITEKSEQELAVLDMREVLDFIEKKVSVKLAIDARDS